VLTAFRLFGYWLLRQVLSLRYRIRITGLEKLRDLRAPVLVLPNHPAFVDPLIVISNLWPYLRVRPMVFEDNFKNPLLWPIISLIDAVPVPDMEKASQEARGRAGEAVAGVIAGLRAGRNHILWPAGRLQRRGVEVIGSARALTEILKEVPEANLVVVRTRGLWGSSFSWAQTGQAPPLVGRLLAGAGLILANLFFFMPRRNVHLTVDVIDRSQLPELRRELINPWFEKWYNCDGNEAPTWVPYHFLFGRRSFDFPKPQGVNDADLAKVTPETRREVNQLIADLLRRPLSPQEDTPETTLDQLGLDSIERMDLNLKVESHFGFTGDRAGDARPALDARPGLARRGRSSRRRRCGSSRPETNGRGRSSARRSRTRSSTAPSPTPATRASGTTCPAS
jgi:long-chain-fatty-acid--[acyl-carrier-protein] ligase